jgi:RimJ/RimL family protein N-acetyltransferase
VLSARLPSPERGPHQRERLVAVEPTEDDVRAHAALLAAAYNDAHNRTMLGHSEDMSPEEVVEYYASMRRAGARAFLLFVDGTLVGDADLRDVEGGTAEFAIMVGARAAQGRGLGTRFATMIHAFAFGALGLHTLYVTIVPQNVASRRVFEKLGYTVDDGPAARSRVDEESDVAMSIGRAEFQRANAEAIAGVRVAEASSVG